MGRYFRENYIENVEIDGFRLPCECYVQVQGGGKTVYTHNGIKEITGIKNRKIIISGRLEASSYDSLLRQVKAVMSLSAKTDALDITSITADSYGIKKIIMENDPKIALISGFDNSRNLTIEAEEEASDDIVKELLEEDRALRSAVTNEIDAVVEQPYTTKKGDSLSTLSLKKYGDFKLWKSIYGFNREIIGSDPNSITENTNLKIPPLNTKELEVVIEAADSYASLSTKYFYHSGYKDMIKRVNGAKGLIAGDKLKIPSLIDTKKQAAALKLAG